MAVIYFCLRPLALSELQGRAQNAAALIRQLGCYIWVPPSENPQGLGLLYVSSGLNGKEKVEEIRICPWKTTADSFWNNLNNLYCHRLKIESQKIRRRFLQLQTEFPTAAAFVPSPYQHRFAGYLIREVHQAHSLANRKALRDDSQTALWGDIHRVPFSA
jgi:hypothetical protein